MILNISRSITYQMCKRKAYNRDILHLLPTREADALAMGAAFHIGSAILHSSRDVETAVKATEAEFRKRLEGQMILSEEWPLIEHQIEQSKAAVKAYSENFLPDFQVLQPEVEFMVELPNSLHHCWFAHEILFPHTEFKDCAYKDESSTTRCWQSHYLKGRTDAVIKWNKLIWLLETKTTAITGDIFYKRWFLDFQPTAYIYGIWKQTGLRPHGFILNIIKKPNRRAHDQFAFGFEREPYLRSNEDLTEFESEITMIAEDYEETMRTKRAYKNPSSCIAYNRTCYYWDMCKRHHVPGEGEFRKREKDYVDLAYYKLLGLEVPVA